MGGAADVNRQVGKELGQVCSSLFSSRHTPNNNVKLLPQDDRPWYRVPHLLKLNLLIGCALQYSSATGYDGSMMNGLLALTDWHTFMDYPTGAWLGFIAAAAALGQIFG
jgi:hypothetical protein